jgi:hypothetical protein
VSGDQIGDVPTWRLAAVADRQHLAELVEGEADL